MGKRVVIIGAGIVGVATAIYLQREGYQVTLIDKRGVAEGASYGNAGVLASCSMIPVTVPGMLTKIPHYLLDPLGPVTLKKRFALKHVGWFFDYLKHCRHLEASRVSAGIQHLVSHSLEEHLSLCGQTSASRYLKEQPYVFLYPSEREYLDEHWSWNTRSLLGYQSETIGGHELHQYIPGLAKKVDFGVICSQEVGGCSNPGAYVKALAETVLHSGGELLHRHVRGFQSSGSKVTEILTDQGSLAADIVVITAGVWSKALIESLGVACPLVAESGYHHMFLGQQLALPGPTMWSPGKCVWSPMQTGLRVAGAAEFSGLEAPHNASFSARLIQHTRQIFPDTDVSNYRSWQGHRPSFPDSLPIIGAVPTRSNVFCGLGHQHIGLTSGPKTGRWLVELINQGESYELSSYAVDRFGYMPC